MRAAILSILMLASTLPATAQSREYLEFNEQKKADARSFHGRKVDGCNRSYAVDPTRRARCLEQAQAYLQQEYQRWDNALRQRQLRQR